MAYNESPVNTTTYKSDFRMTSFRPAARLKTLPMYKPGREMQTNDWKPTMKRVPCPPSTLTIASSPVENCPKLPLPPSIPATTSTRHVVPCPDKFVQTKFGQMDAAQINRLAKIVRWTPTTKRQLEEVHLPVPKIDPDQTTLERKADMVRFDVHRYADQPEFWQHADMFDRYQLRGPVRRTVYPYETNRLSTCPKSRSNSLENLPNAKAIRSLLKEKELPSWFFRKCPRYAGFVPNCPPKDHTTKTVDNPNMVSVMKSSYRELPKQFYVQLPYSRRESFSNMVTLTAPFNPYNKIEPKIWLY